MALARMPWGKREKQLARELADKQRCVTRCICGWYFRGSVRDGKQAFRAHRERCAA